MAEVLLWDIADITTTGTDPFAEGHYAPFGVIGFSTFRIDPDATLVHTNIDDSNSRFEETTSQDLIDPVTIDGKTFAAGEFISTEYSYVVRPVGSIDPSETVTIIVTKIGWTDIVGITSTGPLQKGVDYEFLAVEDNNPNPYYSSLYVCFVSGTAISVPGGTRTVEDLASGDLVTTRDSGAQPLVWVGQRALQFDASNAVHRPIHFSKGSLGGGLPRRDLMTSPQHRIMIETSEEVFCPAKAFVAIPRTRQMKGKRSVTYHTLLLEHHHVIYAEGTPVESFFLGPMSMDILSPRELGEIDALGPALRENFGPLARRSLTMRQSEEVLEARNPLRDGASIGYLRDRQSRATQPACARQAHRTGEAGGQDGGAQPVCGAVA